MDTYGTHYTDIADPGWQANLTERLGVHGLAALSGISSRAALIGFARRLMTIRAHRDAAPDGVTEITDLGSTAPGYGAFTDSALIPHTDGSSITDPPGLVLLTCVQPAAQGGATLVADGAEIIASMAARHPAALRSLSAPRAACFGQAGYLGAVFEPAGAGRTRIRLRLDGLVRFSADAAAAVPLLRTVISEHVMTLHLQAGEGVLLSNTRWLHGRARFDGHRTVLRILGDPLPGTGVQPGFRASDAPARCKGNDGGDVARHIA